MVVEITVTSAENPGDRKRGYEAYTVHIDDHRILTIVTESTFILSKWLKSVLKSSSNTKVGHTILVGLSADSSTASDSFPFDLLSLCVGSHCIIYLFPHSYDPARFSPKSLIAFFENPRVFVAAFNASSLTKKLETLHGIKIKNAIDVGRLALASRPKFDFNLRQCDLDEIAMTVTRMDVDRPDRKEIPWFRHHWSYYWNKPLEPHTLADEKIRFSTLDPYLCFLIASDERMIELGKFCGAAANLEKEPAVEEGLFLKKSNTKRKTGFQTSSSRPRSSSAAAKKKMLVKFSYTRARPVLQVMISTKTSSPSSSVNEEDNVKKIFTKLTKNKKRKIRLKKLDERDRTVTVDISRLVV